MKHRGILLFFFWTVHIMMGHAQMGSHSAIRAIHTNESITPDGVLEEETWQNAPRHGNFWQQFPTDSIPAEGQTELQLAYDDHHLYVAVKLYSNGNDFVVTSLKRDFSFGSNDNITLVFDTYGDQLNAFVFGMNAFGVRREALIANGGRGRGDWQSSWDNKWFGDARMHETYWVAEFMIPFNIIRFQKGSNNWRINLYRNETQLNERSTLTRIPRNRSIMDLSFSTPIDFESPPQGGGGGISLIPFVAASSVRDYEDPEQKKSINDFSIGGDAKIALTPGLNLDLTANPDFSQVEVDRQVTNLGRFEVFFPERRQFFLENADLFGSYGFSRSNPFFSRRIGIVYDSITGQNIQNPILYGARLSGKLNDNFRIGLLNMQTASEKSNSIPGFNFTVASLQHTVFDRSNISFLFVNKQAINPRNFNGDFNSYNRVAGLEYRLLSKDNTWSGKAHYHRVFSPQSEEDAFTHAVRVEKITRNYRFEWMHNLVGNGFDAEVGFVPRKDFLEVSPEFELYFYPKNSVINQHSVSLDGRFFWQVGKDTEQILAPWSSSERETQLRYRLDFKDNTRFWMRVTDTWLVLVDDFDPTRLQEDDVFLPAGSDYHYFLASAEYSTDSRKKFYAEFGPTIGSFFNGSRIGFSLQTRYRFQPYGSVTFNVNYNRVKLKEPFVPVDVWLIGPRIDLTFTKNLFLTAFFQYNNQQDNLNINTRFQWRFAPVSDFFIVYTDNFLVDDSFSQFQQRNRALVAKVTYWLNL